MCVMCMAVYSAVTPALFMMGTVPIASTPIASTQSSLYDMQSIPSVLGQIKAPDVQSPAWLRAQDAAAAAAAQAAKTPSSSKTVNYSISTKGVLSADVNEFRSQISATLNDSRGWAQLGVSFREVASGGSFVLVLSEASQVPSFSPTGCSAEYSCRVGQYVIINQDRWLGATPSWNNAGGSIREYRHMVINHEAGHWLGHGHQSCGGAGQPAPLMLQQSIDLQGCTFNAWPLGSELWSTQLGVDLR